MLEKTIMLKDFEAVKKFVDIANEKPYDIELLSGKYDDLPEAAFHMVGNIDEAVEKAELLRKGV